MSVCDGLGRKIPELKYYAIWLLGGRPTVVETTREKLLERWGEQGGLKAGEATYYRSELPSAKIDNWGEDAVIIKGEIVTPVIKEIDLP